MAETEPTRKSCPIYRHPQWQAWLVVACAVVALVVCAGYLEATVRDDLRFVTRARVLDWNDPQLRFYAVARSHVSFSSRPALLRQVVQMKPSGDITAAAASELAMGFGCPDENLRYALVAARATPADSQMFAPYVFWAASTLEKQHRVAEAEAMLTTGVRSAATLKGQTFLLGRLLRLVNQNEGLPAMLALYACYSHDLPSVAHSDHVQESVAIQLDEAGRHADAQRTYLYLAQNATNPYIRERAQKKLAGGGAANGH